jgi:hypothetical protein
LCKSFRISENKAADKHHAPASTEGSSATTLLSDEAQPRRYPATQTPFLHASWPASASTFDPSQSRASAPGRNFEDCELEHANERKHEHERERKRERERQRNCEREREHEAGDSLRQMQELLAQQMSDMNKMHQQQLFMLRHSEHQLAQLAAQAPCNPTLRALLAPDPDSTESHSQQTLDLSSAPSTIKKQRKKRRPGAKPVGTPSRDEEDVTVRVGSSATQGGAAEDGRFISSTTQSQPLHLGPHSLPLKPLASGSTAPPSLSTRSHVLQSTYSLRSELLGTEDDTGESEGGDEGGLNQDAGPPLSPHTDAVLGGTSGMVTLLYNKVAAPDADKHSNDRSYAYWHASSAASEAPHPPPLAANAAVVPTKAVTIPALQQARLFDLHRSDVPLIQQRQLSEMHGLAQQSNVGQSLRTSPIGAMGWTGAIITSPLGSPVDTEIAGYCYSPSTSSLADGPQSLPVLQKPHTPKEHAQSPGRPQQHRMQTLPYDADMPPRVSSTLTDISMGRESAAPPSQSSTSDLLSFLPAPPLLAHLAEARALLRFASPESAALLLRDQVSCRTMQFAFTHGTPEERRVIHAAVVLNAQAAVKSMFASFVVQMLLAEPPSRERFELVRALSRKSAGRSSAGYSEASAADLAELDVLEGASEENLRNRNFVLDRETLAQQRHRAMVAKQCPLVALACDRFSSRIMQSVLADVTRAPASQQTQEHSCDGGWKVDRDIEARIQGLRKDEDQTRMVASATAEELSVLLRELGRVAFAILALCCDAIGSHVIEALLFSAAVRRSNFLDEAAQLERCAFVERRLLPLATAPCVLAVLASRQFGVVVAQRLFDYLNAAERDSDEVERSAALARVRTRFVGSVAAQARKLARCRYGNFLVSYVIDNGEPREAATVAANLVSGMPGAGQSPLELATHSYASRVVEKALRRAPDIGFSPLPLVAILFSPEQRVPAQADAPLALQGNVHVRARVVHDALSPAAFLLFSSFGNYVLQAALEAASETQLEAGFAQLLPHLPALAQLQCGTKVARLLVARLPNKRPLLEHALHAQLPPHVPRAGVVRAQRHPAPIVAPEYLSVAHAMQPQEVTLSQGQAPPSGEPNVGSRGRHCRGAR